MSTSTTIRHSLTHLACVRCACFTLLLALVVGLPVTASADASLYLSPPSAVIPIGEEFTLAVLIDTGGELVNAIEGSLSLTQEDVELIAVNTDDSIVSSWIERPQLDPATGRLTFSGATAVGGYQGAAGEVLTLTLRALRPSASQVWFSQGAAAFSANGQASNVLSGLRSGTYTLTQRDIVPEITTISTPARSANSPLRSSTHPDPDGWAATTTAFLFWELPESVDALRLDVSRDPQARPTTLYEPAVPQLTIPDLPEGENVAHLQFREAGTWGPVYSYPLRVDITPPEELTITETPRSDRTDPRVGFSFSTVDEGSGVTHYEIALNGGRSVRWGVDDAQQGAFLPSDIEPGEHTLTVIAFDAADNTIERSVQFVVEPLPMPELASMTDVNVGERLSVRGSAPPGALVEVEYSLNDGEWERRTVEADGAGSFVMTITELARSGDYEIRARVRDERGATSLFTAPLVVTVAQPTLLLFGSVAVSYLTILLSLIGLVSLLAFVLWLGWLAVRRARGLVRVETREAEDIVHASFGELEQKLSQHVANLTAASRERPLTREEEQVLLDLSRQLTQSEEHIIDEIEDIESAARPQPLRITRMRS